MKLKHSGFYGKAKKILSPQAAGFCFSFYWKYTGNKEHLVFENNDRHLKY